MASWIRRTECRRHARAGVDAHEQSAVVTAHDDVEVAVAVEIAESGGSEVVDCDAGDLDRRAEDGRGGRAGVADREQLALNVCHHDVEVAVGVEIAERRDGIPVDVDAGEKTRIGKAQRRAERCGAGSVGHLDRQRPAGRRRVRRIGIGQVLDQRLDRLRSRRAVEGDGEVAAGAAGNSADRHAAERHRPPANPISPAPLPWLRIDTISSASRPATPGCRRRNYCPDR